MKILNDEIITACYRLCCACFPLIAIYQGKSDTGYTISVVLCALFILIGIIRGILIALKKASFRDRGSLLDAVGDLLAFPYCFMLMGLITREFYGQQSTFVFWFTVILAILIIVSDLLTAKKK